ncbi:hypothetical protein LARI1_G008506 [Lachnellula arida]|uniref:Uncharacterized protein n=1 Tax=Lachnellula arida TaxID=1316785 RepID=A0A8T9B198_9HELO|nr:hypothetical protein LARI1_G008506 [Lachnellula arida]
MTLFNGDLETILGGSYLSIAARIISSAIVLVRGIVDLARVKIDISSLYNLLPRSIASRLGLPLHFGSSIRVNLLSDLGNYRYYIQGPHGNRNELPIPGPIAEAEAETEFAMEGEIAIGAAVIREETLMAEEALTALRGDEGHGDEECELGELASVDAFATGDETISNTEFFADAVSYQSSDDDLYYIDRLAEGRELGVEGKE